VRREKSWRRAVALTVGLVAGLVGGASDATAQLAPTDRFVVRLNYGGRPDYSRTFAGSSVFTAFVEQGTYQTDYRIEQGDIVEGGFSVRLWRNIAVGLDGSRYRSVNPALIASEVPHPFFFGMPRTTTSETGGLEREELSIHLRAQWMMQLGDWLVVSMSAGPSLINVRQDLITSIEHTEVGFPFDEVIISAQTVGGQFQSVSTIGQHGGVDIDAYVLHKLPLLNRIARLRHVGVGLLIRYVQGTVDLQVGDDTVEIDLGGLQVAGGLRFRF